MERDDVFVIVKASEGFKFFTRSGGWTFGINDVERLMPFSYEEGLRCMTLLNTIHAENYLLVSQQMLVDYNMSRMALIGGKRV